MGHLFCCSIFLLVVAVFVSGSSSWFAGTQFSTSPSLIISTPYPHNRLTRRCGRGLSQLRGAAIRSCLHYDAQRVQHFDVGADLKVERMKTFILRSAFLVAEAACSTAPKTGGTMTRYIQVHQPSVARLEIAEISAFDSGGTNVANGAAVTMSGNSTGFLSANCNDGSNSTTCKFGEASAGSLLFDLDGDHDLMSVVLVLPSATAENAIAATVSLVTSSDRVWQEFMVTTDSTTHTFPVNRTSETGGDVPGETPSVKTVIFHKYVMTSTSFHKFIIKNSSNGNIGTQGSAVIIYPDRENDTGLGPTNVLTGSVFGVADEGTVPHTSFRVTFPSARTDIKSIEIDISPAGTLAGARVYLIDADGRLVAKLATANSAAQSQTVTLSSCSDDPAQILLRRAAASPNLIVSEIEFYKPGSTANLFASSAPIAAGLGTQEQATSNLVDGSVATEMELESAVIAPWVTVILASAQPMAVFKVKTSIQQPLLAAQLSRAEVLDVNNRIIAVFVLTSGFRFCFAVFASFAGAPYCSTETVSHTMTVSLELPQTNTTTLSATASKTMSVTASFGSPSHTVPATGTVSLLPSATSTQSSTVSLPMTASLTMSGTLLPTRTSTQPHTLTLSNTRSITGTAASSSGTVAVSLSYTGTATLPRSPSVSLSRSVSVSATTPLSVSKTTTATHRTTATASAHHTVSLTVTASVTAQLSATRTLTGPAPTPTTSVAASASNSATATPKLSHSTTASHVRSSTATKAKTLTPSLPSTRSPSAARSGTTTQSSPRSPSRTTPRTASSHHTATVLSTPSKTTGASMTRSKSTTQAGGAKHTATVTSTVTVPVVPVVSPGSTPAPIIGATDESTIVNRASDPGCDSVCIAIAVIASVLVLAACCGFLMLLVCCWSDRKRKEADKLKRLSIWELAARVRPPTDRDNNNNGIPDSSCAVDNDEFAAISIASSPTNARRSKKFEHDAAEFAGSPYSAEGFAVMAPLDRSLRGDLSPQCASLEHSPRSACSSLRFRGTRAAKRAPTAAKRNLEDDGFSPVLSPNGGMALSASASRHHQTDSCSHSSSGLQNEFRPPVALTPIPSSSNQGRPVNREHDDDSDVARAMAANDGTSHHSSAATATDLSRTNVTDIVLEIQNSQRISHGVGATGGTVSISHADEMISADERGKSVGSFGANDAQQQQASTSRTSFRGSEGPKRSASVVKVEVATPDFSLSEIDGDRDDVSPSSTASRQRKVSDNKNRSNTNDSSKKSWNGSSQSTTTTASATRFATDGEDSLPRVPSRSSASVPFRSPSPMHQQQQQQQRSSGSAVLPPSSDPQSAGAGDNWGGERSPSIATTDGTPRDSADLIPRQQLSTDSDVLVDRPGHGENNEGPPKDDTKQPTPRAHSRLSRGETPEFIHPFGTPDHFAKPRFKEHAQQPSSEEQREDDGSVGDQSKRQDGDEEPNGEEAQQTIPVARRSRSAGAMETSGRRGRDRRASVLLAADGLTPSGRVGILPRARSFSQGRRSEGGAMSLQSNASRESSPDGPDQFVFTTADQEGAEVPLSRETVRRSLLVSRSHRSRETHISCSENELDLIPARMPDQSELLHSSSTLETPADSPSNGQRDLFAAFEARNDAAANAYESAAEPTVPIRRRRSRRMSEVLAEERSSRSNVSGSAIAGDSVTSSDHVHPGVANNGQQTASFDGPPVANGNGARPPRVPKPPARRPDSNNNGVKEEGSLTTEPSRVGHGIGRRRSSTGRRMSTEDTKRLARMASDQYMQMSSFPVRKPRSRRASEIQAGVMSATPPPGPPPEESMAAKADQYFQTLLASASLSDEHCESTDDGSLDGTASDIPEMAAGPHREREEDLKVKAGELANFVAFSGSVVIAPHGSHTTDAMPAELTAQVSQIAFAESGPFATPSENQSRDGGGEIQDPVDDFFSPVAGPLAPTAPPSGPPSGEGADARTARPFGHRHHRPLDDDDEDGEEAGVIDCYAVAADPTPYEAFRRMSGVSPSPPSSSRVERSGRASQGQGQRQGQGAKQRLPPLQRQTVPPSAAKVVADPTPYDDFRRRSVMSPFSSPVSTSPQNNGHVEKTAVPAVPSREASPAPVENIHPSAVFGEASVDLMTQPQLPPKAVADQRPSTDQLRRRSSSVKPHDPGAPFFFKYIQAQHVPVAPAAHENPTFAGNPRSSSVVSRLYPKTLSDMSPAGRAPQPPKISSRPVSTQRPAKPQTASVGAANRRTRAPPPFRAFSGSFSDCSDADGQHDESGDQGGPKNHSRAQSQQDRQGRSRSFTTAKPRAKSMQATPHSPKHIPPAPRRSFAEHTGHLNSVLSMYAEHASSVLSYWPGRRPSVPGEIQSRRESRKTTRTESIADLAAAAARGLEERHHVHAQVQAQQQRRESQQQQPKHRTFTDATNSAQPPDPAHNTNGGASVSKNERSHESERSQQSQQSHEQNGDHDPASSLAASATSTPPRVMSQQCMRPVLGRDAEGTETPDVESASAGISLDSPMAQIDEELVTVGSVNGDDANAMLGQRSPAPEDAAPTLREFFRRRSTIVASSDDVQVASATQVPAAQTGGHESVVGPKSKALADESTAAVAHDDDGGGVNPSHRPQYRRSSRPQGDGPRRSTVLVLEPVPPGMLEDNDGDHAEGEPGRGAGSSSSTSTTATTTATTDGAVPRGRRSVAGPGATSVVKRRSPSPTDRQNDVDSFGLPRPRRRSSVGVPAVSPLQRPPPLSDDSSSDGA